MTRAPDVELVGIGAGAVAVMHRPKVKLLPALRSVGVTHLVTLLSRREGALAVGAAAKAAGLEWIWVELPNGQQPPPPRHHEVVAALTTLVGAIGNGAKVVVHCSAGIHRTGQPASGRLTAAAVGPVRPGAPPPSPVLTTPISRAGHPAEANVGRRRALILGGTVHSGHLAAYGHGICRCHRLSSPRADGVCGMRVQRRQR